MNENEDKPALPTRIYTYGLPLGPKENAALVDEQIRLARRYHNDLIAIERARRVAVRAIMSEVADVAAIEARVTTLASEIETLREATRAKRQQDRKRTPIEPMAKARLEAARAEVKTARDELKAAKALLRDDPVVQQKLADCNGRAAEMVRLYRGACGVYWGTYLLVEQAVDAARKSKMDPKHRRWDGAGRVGVQLQGGLAVAELYGGDTRIRIDTTPLRRVTRRHPEGFVVQKSATVRLRVGSDGRAPVWASFPVILHRPLPEDGRIKWAWCQRKRIGTRWRWELQLVLEAPSFARVPKLHGPVCAVDLGWRERGDAGLRVGYLAGTDGEERELLMTREIGGRLEHADSLRAIRDRNFNDARAALGAWLGEHEHPEWLRIETRYLAQWRATAKLARVVYRWRNERFDGDAAIFETVDAWRRQDRHLYQWEASERTKALLFRRETYRLLATEIARRYSTIVIEDLDLSQLARRAAPEATEGQHAGARHQRVAAAPSEFRAALKLAASNTGAQIVMVKPQYTTTTCFSCGGSCSWDAALYLSHTCEHCGYRWDQDANAALNLLQLHLRGAAKMRNDSSEALQI